MNSTCPVFVPYVPFLSIIKFNWVLFPMSIIEPLCIHSEVNVSSTQTLNPSDDTVTVNYTVTRNERTFIPIIVDIYLSGGFLGAFQCQNGSIIDGGEAIVQVIFRGSCEDPIVTVNRNITVSIGLDLLELSDPTCSTVTIGPQSECAFSQSYKLRSITLAMCPTPTCL